MSATDTQKRLCASSCAPRAAAASKTCHSHFEEPFVAQGTPQSTPRRFQQPTMALSMRRRVCSELLDVPSRFSISPRQQHTSTLASTLWRPPLAAAGDGCHPVGIDQGRPPRPAIGGSTQLVAGDGTQPSRVYPTDNSPSAKIHGLDVQGYDMRCFIPSRAK